MPEEKESTVRKLAVEIIVGLLVAIVIEPTIRLLNLDRLIRYVPYIWLVIFASLTLDILARWERFRDWLRNISGSLPRGKRILSYVVIGAVGACILIVYWAVITAIFPKPESSPSSEKKITSESNPTTSNTSGQPKQPPPATVSKPESSSTIGSSISRPPGRVAGEVIFADFGPFHRFYQEPPIYFQRLDSALYVSITNQTGKPLYIRRYYVKALVGNNWIKFTNAENIGIRPDSFGAIGVGPGRRYLQHFDLSKKGFDFVTQEWPLNQDEDLEAWMFFISGLPRDDFRKINEFKVTVYDSAEEEYGFVSKYPSKRLPIVAIPIDLPLGLIEPIPANLREEPHSVPKEP
jgi:hypothetical protein